jgi:hypothetical protein
MNCVLKHNEQVMCLPSSHMIESCNWSVVMWHFVQVNMMDVFRLDLRWKMWEMEMIYILLSIFGRFTNMFHKALIDSLFVAKSNSIGLVL